LLKKNGIISRINFFIVIFEFSFFVSEGITANVMALGAVADFGAQNCQNTTKVNAR